MDEKRCVTCHLLQPLSQYNKRAAARDGLQARCRACSRAWYVANSDDHKARARARNDRVRAEKRVLYEAFLQEHPCVDCGEQDLRVLELDHEDRAEKLIEVGRIVGSGMSWARVMEEIAKCSVRCANCHRRRTAEQMGYWRHAAEANRRARLATAAEQRLSALLR